MCHRSLALEDRGKQIQLRFKQASAYGRMQPP